MHIAIVDIHFLKDLVIFEKFIEILVEHKLEELDSNNLFIVFNIYFQVFAISIDRYRFSLLFQPLRYQVLYGKTNDVIICFVPILLLIFY